MSGEGNKGRKKEAKEKMDKLFVKGPKRKAGWR